MKNYLKLVQLILNIMKLSRNGYKVWLGKRLAIIAVLFFVPMMALADPANYFVVKESIDGSLSVVSHQIVNLDGALESTALPAESIGVKSQLAVNVRDKTNSHTLFTTTVSASPWLRGEFHGQHEIEGHAHVVDDRFYAVRVPVPLNAILQLDGNRETLLDPVAKQAPSNAFTSKSAGTTLVIDLDSYTSIAGALPPPPPGYATGSLRSNGPASNRLDLLVVAEGYTAAQQPQFIQQATTLIDSFLSISPYADYQHLINVTWLFVPSNQSGADKPSCAESPGSAVVVVDTAFDGTFCSFGTRRLVTVSTPKVLTAAGAAADWDQIMVLVNDTEYGGSGGSVPVATTHSLSAQIMQHEFGHSFAELADEYSSPVPSIPSCSDVIGAKPCPLNVSDQTDRNKLKWRQWVDSQTPIPTMLELADPIGAGLWEGAYYQTTGMYRQCHNGIMRNLGRPFCHVDGEAFVRRLFGPGWGLPSQGVSLIEPGSLPTFSDLKGVVGSKFDFSATVTGSTIPGSLAVTWRVDGGVASQTSVNAGSLVKFSFTLPNLSTHTIELVVTDLSTKLVLPPSPQSTRTWTIQGLTGGYELSVSKSGIGFGTVTSDPTGISCGSSCNASFDTGASVTLTASSTQGSFFSGWSGACDGTGICVVDMSAAKSVAASFAAASQLGQTIGTVGFSPSTLSVGGTSTASATSTSGLAVSFGSTTPTTCSVSGSTVSGVSSGICTIAANQPGNASYSAAPQVSANITVTSANPARLINISTRGQVSAGDGVMIGGFIISGTANKKVLIRAIGPNLANFGISGTLPDPKLELFEGSTLIGSNDNWQTQAIAADVAAITATGLAPANVAESALLVTLKPGVAYTAVVTGVNVPSGVGIVEVFEADHPEYQLINISTRGRVETGEAVMIGGFIIQGDAPKTVLIRAVGPNLANYGVSGVLADPTMEIYRSSDGVKIAQNDDWQTQTIAADVTAITATGLSPVDPRESAILLTLPPGAYTAVVSGKNGGKGVGIVEVFAR